jgi:hypothetical protein
MKRILIILLMLIAILPACFYLAKHTRRQLSTFEPANAVSASPSLETNVVEIAANASFPEPILLATNAIKPISSMINALTATNLQQWLTATKGLHKMPGLSESWDMEQTNLTASIPIKFQQNGETVYYKAQFIDISIKNGKGDILEAQLHSPIMNINETRELGLQLCNMLKIDSKDFLTWCDKVGNNWLGAPLFGVGNKFYSFQIIGGYSNEKPWVINFMIIPNP